MADTNYNFNEHGSLEPYNIMRKETILKAITSEIEYNYDVYSDEEYIEKQKKMLNDTYNLEWLTLYKDSVIDFISRITDAEKITKANKRFLPILEERNKLLADKFETREEAPEELLTAGGRKHRKSQKHRKFRKHRKSQKQRKSRRHKRKY